LAVAEKQLFRHCLVTMRPKTTQKDLPSAHDVSTHIHNEFSKWLISLKTDIEMSKAGFE
ncbi:hypothetical protein JOM56_004447, partial [Amanita muscaria]